MLIHTRRLQGIKQIIFIAGAIVVPSQSLLGDVQSYDFTNTQNDNLWNRVGNWSAPLLLPTTADIARIPPETTGTFTRSKISITNGTIATTASVGKLIINSIKENYDGLRASDAFDTGGSAITGTLQFGSSGGIDLEMDTKDTPAPTFGLGLDPSADGELKCVVPGSLAVRVAPFQTLFLGATVISGASSGSITYSRLGSGSIEAFVDVGAPSGTSVPSTYSGGTTINSDVLLSVFSSSSQNGTLVTNGPFGTGTVTLAG